MFSKLKNKAKGKMHSSGLMVNKDTLMNKSSALIKNKYSQSLLGNIKSAQYAIPCLTKKCKDALATKKKDALNKKNENMIRNIKKIPVTYNSTIHSIYNTGVLNPANNSNCNSYTNSAVTTTPSNNANKNTASILNGGVYKPDPPASNPVVCSIEHFCVNQKNNKEYVLKIIAIIFIIFLVLIYLYFYIREIYFRIKKKKKY